MEGDGAIVGGELEEIGNFWVTVAEKDRTGGCHPACAVFLSDVYELVKRLLFFVTELFVYDFCKLRFYYP